MKKLFVVIKASSELIKKVINQYHWLRTLTNVNKNQNVFYFTKKLLNIIRYFTMHYFILYYFIQKFKVLQNRLNMSNEKCISE